jgi:hypothetical protein
MAIKTTVLGLFDTEEKIVSAIRGLKDSPWTLQEVFSPIPGHDLAKELNLGKSKVGYFTLAGGILGFFSGFFLAAWTAGQWDLIVSGKPVISLIPFFIVGFELTILFGVAANVLGFLIFAGLPRLRLPEYYDPRCSGALFGLAASCGPEDREALTAFLKKMGAEISDIGLR